MANLLKIYYNSGAKTELSNRIVNEWNLFNVNVTESHTVTVYFKEN